MAAPIDYFEDVSKTDLMRVAVALATEVYALQDRLTALEALLADYDIDVAALRAPAEPAAFDESRRAARDAFVERVFAALSTPVRSAVKQG